MQVCEICSSTGSPIYDKVQGDRTELQNIPTLPIDKPVRFIDDKDEYRHLGELSPYDTTFSKGIRRTL